MWMFYGALFIAGCVLGLIVLEIIERYPRKGDESSSSSAFSSSEGIWNDTATPQDIHDAIARAVENAAADKDNDNNNNEQITERNNFPASFRTFKLSKNYAHVKGLLGLTDAQIEIAFELAKKGKRLPPPPTVRVVRFLDNAFLFLLLGTLAFALYREYSWSISPRWIRHLFPRERALIGDMIGRAKETLASLTTTAHGEEL